jgi:hypothetical protein
MIRREKVMLRVRLRSARKVRTRSFCANPLVDVCSHFLSPDQSIFALCVETLQNPISGLNIVPFICLHLFIFSLSVETLQNPIGHLNIIHFRSRNQFVFAFCAEPLQNPIGGLQRSVS